MNATVAHHTIPRICWHPPLSLAGKTPMDTYRKHINTTFHQSLLTTHDLQRWSIDSPQDFWCDLYTYLDLTPALPPEVTVAYDAKLPMSANPAFFTEVRLNYAENAVFADRNDSAVALIGLREGMDVYSDTEAFEVVTWGMFREKVRVVSSALRRSGVKQGDRVGALVATSVWAIVLFHAVAAVGAVFTSISPELGVGGCVARLRQVGPRILFVDSHAVYKGKVVEVEEKVEEIVERLQEGMEVFVIPVVPGQTRRPAVDEFLGRAREEDELRFTRVPFNYPLMICYSSGTTGPPKCIVHQHGVIIQYKKISRLHNSLGPGDVVMQYSSTSWVVFYVMCGHFSVGATLVVYNGSPLFPDAKQLLRICEKFHVTFLGASPRLLLEIEMSKTIPKDEFDLSALKIVYTTGATLGLEQYRWFYRSFPESIHICNTAGGTDTATSLIALDPCAPVHEGEMQVAGLGMAVDVADPVTGESIALTGEAGEMVVRKPFPSMPCFFWGDKDGQIYKSAYFERFDNVDVWAQHDWLSQNPKTGGYMMHGRSDGVLNPSGIRFGSGEIYSIVETDPFTQQISNTLCVGRRRTQDTDEEVFLFLVMKPGYTLTPELRNQVKQAIRNGLSARHVPKFVLAVPEIAMTVNGKKVESAIKQIISGKDVTPSATVSNPGSFAWFTRYRTIEREPKDVKL